MSSKRWGWVRILPEPALGGALFEACAPIPDGPPGDDWIEVDDAVVEFLFRMQSKVFVAEEALRSSRDLVRRACSQLDYAQDALSRAAGSR